MKKATVVLIFVLVCPFAFAQQLTPAPTFNLLNTGYGAAALGMGGAFVAVADDLSAIYWNPAGLSQVPGLGLYVDYRLQGDSDEDFSEVVYPNRFESKQRYSISGNQFESAAFSYSFKSTSGYVFVPAFAYHRTSAIGPERALKDSVGLVKEEFDNQSEYAFAISAKVNDRVMVGGSWNFLAGEPEVKLTGTFHETLVVAGGARSSDINLEQVRRDSLSGNYLNVGLLLVPKPFLRIGTTLRFPYTRESDITLERKGTVTSDMGSGSFQINATAKGEVDVPLEWTTGMAIRTTSSLTIAGSLTYSDWSESQLKITDSSNLDLLPEGSLPYPTLREGTAAQMSLIQWRAGAQYSLGRQPGLGPVMRTGIFRDSQPLGNISVNRIWFNGYSFGVGYRGQSYHLDLTFVREKGELIFRPQDSDFSTFKNRRWILSFGLSS